MASTLVFIPELCVVALNYESIPLVSTEFFLYNVSVLALATECYLLNV